MAPYSVATLFPELPLSRTLSPVRGEVTVPPWAREVMRRVCAREGHPEPRLTWARQMRTRRELTHTLGLGGVVLSSREVRGPHDWSSGWTNAFHHCHVREGIDTVDSHFVLLHELAHDIAGCNFAHGRTFQRTLARLCLAEDAELGTTFAEYGVGRDGNRYRVALRSLQREAGGLWTDTLGA